MKAKRLSVDKVTSLPQTIIETILCLLPIEEAVRTSILSSEWRYKWTKIPKLGFFESTVERPSDKKPVSRRNVDMRCKLFYAIHQVLLLHQGPIQEFTLSMDARRTFFEIDQIILYLSRNHKLKKLALNFFPDSSGYSDYDLPSSLFLLHHLTDLDLEYCGLYHVPKFIGFGSLTSLSLSRVMISSKDLLHVLSNCPSLKSLSLFLHIDNLGDCLSITELFKCLPMIEHLTTWVETVPLLVQASVPEDLSASLIHLKYCCIEQIEFDNVYGLVFLVALMKCSPNLEKINLEEGSLIGEIHEFEDFCAIFEDNADVWLESLNELKIVYFNNFKEELEFVKFILARSPKLKKVILSTYVSDKNEELEMLRIPLGAPRASPVVQIIVENLWTIDVLDDNVEIYDDNLVLYLLLLSFLFILE